MQLTRPRPDVPAQHNGSPPASPPRPRGQVRRATVLAGRLVLWTAILVLAVRGGASTVDDLRSSPAPAPVAELDGTPRGFPTEAAESLATRFAHDYLTYGPDDSRRAERLAAYGFAGGRDELGWDGNGEQAVRAAVAVDVAVHGPDRAAVLVAAHVSDGRWLHLSVPVIADAAGRVAVTDTPILVAAPRLAAAPPTADPPVDAALGRELEPVLESFFEAYATGRADDLAYYLPVGRELDGLDGSVELDELVDLHVAHGGTVRDAFAVVRWRDTSTEAGLTQRYTLRLVDRDGRWYVDGFGAADPPTDDGPDPTGQQGGERDDR